MSFNKKLLWLAISLIAVLAVAGCDSTGAAPGGDTDPTPDTTAPTVTAHSPTSGAIDVAINGSITATFSEAMEAATVVAANFTLSNGTTAVGGTVSYVDGTAKFAPDANLTADTEYTATMTTSMTDVAGNQLAADETWTFTTGSTADTTAPTVGVTVPTDAATDVALNTNITATFSEAMDLTTIVAANFTVTQGTTPVTGTVSYINSTAKFVPSADLTSATEYTVTITTGATDLAGNALAANKVWTFTTGAAPDLSAPSVTSTSPTASATGVGINTNITALFSEPMDPTTIIPANITVAAGATAVLGSVTYSPGDKTAIFSPNANLVAATEYTVTITTAAQDASGIGMTADKVWTFTTAAAGAGPDPVRLGTAGNYAVLAKTSIANTPTSAITGNLGLSPAAQSYITGFSQTDATGYSTSPQVTGYIYAADMAPPTNSNLTTAISDMEAAYTDAAGRTTPDFTNPFTGAIGGQTLTPGLYTWTSAVGIGSDVTISGAANDVWIFQTTGDLTAASDVSVLLTGGAQAKNIFWQVGGAVTIGTNSHMEGVLLSYTGITFGTGASLNGRILAQSAATLSQNTLVAPTQ